MTKTVSKGSIPLIALALLSPVHGATELTAGDTLREISLHTSNHEYESTIPLFEKLLRKKKDPSYYTGFATSLFKAGMRTRAEKILKNLYKRYPHDSVVNFYLGVLYFENREVEKSIEHFENAYLTRFKPFHARYYMGLISYRKQDYHRALVQFLEVAGKSIALKQRALLYCSLCKINLHEEKFEYLYDAENLLKQSIEIDPDSPVAKICRNLVKKTSLIISNRNIKARQLMGVGFTLDGSRDSNLFENPGAKAHNLINFQATAFFVPMKRRNLKIEGLYHNYTLMTVSDQPDESLTFRPSHLLRPILIYSPRSFTTFRAYADYLIRKDISGTKIRKVTMSFDGAREFLSFLTPHLKISLFQEKQSSIENSFSGYMLTFTQFFLVSRITPFLRFYYQQTSHTEDTLAYSLDKYLAGIKIEKFLSDLEFLTFLSRSYRRSEIATRESETTDTIYAVLRKTLNSSVYGYLHGEYRRKTHPISGGQNFSRYIAGTGISVAF